MFCRYDFGKLSCHGKRLGEDVVKMECVQLTLREILECYESSRKSGCLKSYEPKFSEAIRDKVSKCNIELTDSDQEQLEIEITNLYRKVTRFWQKSVKERKKYDLNSVWLSYKLSNNVSTSELIPLDESKGRTKKPLNDVSERQKYRRIKRLTDLVTELAQEENTEIPYMLGLILHAKYYETDRRLAHISNLLMNLEENIKMVDLPVASKIKNSCNLGREKYQTLKNSLEFNRVKCLPTWKELRAYEKNITPTITAIPDHMGVSVNYHDALQMTARTILSGLDLQNNAQDLIMEVKDGVDGSGSHSIFNQKGMCLIIKSNFYMFVISTMQC